MSQLAKLITARLFAGGDIENGPISAELIATSEVFHEFQGLIDQELSRQERAQPSEHQALLAEHQTLRGRQTGWMQSLADPNLHSSLRQSPQEQFVVAAERIAEIELLLSKTQAVREVLSCSSTPERVAEVINRLGEVLLQDNPSVTNLELARHIDLIRVSADGRIQIRMCKLGFLADMTNLHTSQDDHSDCQATIMVEPSERMATRPRRMIPFSDSKPWEWKLRPDYSIDPHRFDHFADEWFWVDEFQIPVKQCWSVENAISVAQSRLGAPCGLEVLAKRFGRTKTTIMAALQQAKSQGVDATQIDARRLQPNWAIDHAAEVAEYFQRTGATMTTAVEFFGKSDAWIRTARRYAETGLPEDSSIPSVPQTGDSIR